jgi:WD40 repeat protein
LLYVTSLPFTPTNTSIHKIFDRNHLPKVVCDGENIWPRELQHSKDMKITFHPSHFRIDGFKIVSGSGDKTIRVWDVKIGVEMLPPLRGHEGRICSVAFSPDGSKIVSGSDDNTIRVWDATTGVEMLSPLRGHEDRINSVAFSRDASKIISWSADTTIRVLDASTGVEMIRQLQGLSSIDSFTLSLDGSKFISKTGNGIRIWDAGTGVELKSVQTPVDDISVAALDGLIVSMNKEWFININTGHCIARLPVESSYYAHKSRYVGWTVDHKIVIIQFPAL